MRIVAVAMWLVLIDLAWSRILYSLVAQMVVHLANLLGGWL